MWLWSEWPHSSCAGQYLAGLPAALASECCCLTGSWLEGLSCLLLGRVLCLWGEVHLWCSGAGMDRRMTCWTRWGASGACWGPSLSSWWGVCCIFLQVKMWCTINSIVNNNLWWWFISTYKEINENQNKQSEVTFSISIKMLVFCNSEPRRRETLEEKMIKIIKVYYLTQCWCHC